MRRNEELFLRILPRLSFEEDCWIWTGWRRGGNQNRGNGRRHGTRYGGVRYQGEALYVHRVLFEVFRGEIPDGAVVEHRHGCQHGGLCVNPRYLSLGTPESNGRRAAALTNEGHLDAYEEEF